MLKTKQITVDSPDFKKIKNLYYSAFPREERMPFKYLIKPSSSNEFIACYDRKKFCGFYSAMTFDDVTHILFLAVDKTERDRGYGSKILRTIERNHRGKRIILDIEAPDANADNNEQRLRRKAFYKRGGYTETDIKYVENTVSYEILIKRGSKISEDEFNRFWDAYNLLRASETEKDNATVTFRAITESDRELFFEMSEEFYASEAVLRDVPRGHHERAFDELMRSREYLDCYIIEFSGVPAGFALLCKTYSREAGGVTIWIDELYIRPDYQGHGAGAKFFRFAEDNIPAARYRLEVEPENLGAARLYRRLGYEDLPYMQMVKDK